MNPKVCDARRLGPLLQIDIDTGEKDEDGDPVIARYQFHATPPDEQTAEAEHFNRCATEALRLVVARAAQIIEPRAVDALVGKELGDG